MVTIKKRTWMLAGVVAVVILAIGFLAYFAISVFASTANEMTKVYEVIDSADYTLQHMTITPASMMTVGSSETATKSNIQMKTIYPAPNPMMTWKYYNGTPNFAPLEPTYSERKMDTADITSIQDTSLNTGLSTSLSGPSSIPGLVSNRKAPFPMYFTLKPNLAAGDTIQSIDFTLTQLPAGALITAGKDLSTVQANLNNPPSGVPECNPACSVGFGGINPLNPITPDTEIYVAVLPFMRPDNPSFSTADKYFLGGIQADVNYKPTITSEAIAYKNVPEDSADTETLWKKINITGAITIPTGAAAKIQWFTADTASELSAKTTLIDKTDPNYATKCPTGRCSRIVDLSKLGVAPYGDLADGTVYPKGRYGKFVVKLYVPLIAIPGTTPVQYKVDATKNPTVFNNIQIFYTVITPTPAPTITLTVKKDANATPSEGPIDVTTGSTVILSWTTTDTTSCTASANPAMASWSGAKGVNGTATTAGLTAAVNTFSLNCSGDGGMASKSVTVNASNLPTVNITANGSDGPPLAAKIEVGKGLVIGLAWNSTNATSCAATGAWSGAKLTAGGENSPAITADGTTFTITCTGPGGVSNPDSVTINLAPVTACEKQPVITEMRATTSLNALNPIFFNHLDKKTGTHLTIIGENFGDAKGTIAMANNTENYPVVATDIITWADKQIEFYAPTATNDTLSSDEPIKNLEAQTPGIVAAITKLLKWIKIGGGVTINARAKPYQFVVTPVVLGEKCVPAKNDKITSRYVYKFIITGGLGTVTQGVNYQIP